MDWRSLLVEDFEYLPSPRAEPPYSEEARNVLAAMFPKYVHKDLDKDENIYGWPELRLERQILRGWKSHHLGEILGTRIEHHHIRFLCHLIPSLEPDPWFQERVASFYDAPLKHKRKVINWFGCQNSGKTSSMAAMAIGFGVLHPEYTRQTISGPFKEAGEFPLWGEILSFFEEARSTWGDQLASWTGGIYDKKRKMWDSNEKLTTCLMKPNSSKGVLRFSETPKAGSIKLVAMDEVGKVQGAKAKDRLQSQGYFILWLDEIGAGYPTLAIMDVLDNLKSNRNLRVITSCNPKSPVGQLDGEMGRPHGGYESLNIDSDFTWNSAAGSRTYRFDGMRSPNFAFPHEPWPYLFNQERKDNLLQANPENSDRFRSQARAFMNVGSGDRYVLTIPDIRAGMTDAPFDWSIEEKQRSAFLDPALSTGGDDAVYTLLETGTKQGVDGSRTPVFYVPKQVVIPILTGFIADQQWVQMCETVRGKSKKGDNHTLGQLIPVEEQLAIRAGYQLMLDKVPFSHFGYDDSMRGKIMVAFLWALGDAPLVVSMVGEADDTPMYPPKKTPPDDKGKTRLITWKEDCSKFVSQLWFFGAAVVRSGFFRCHPDVMVALNEATSRFWDYAAGGRRREVESKKALREHNFNRSPDRPDSLFGVFHVAFKRGLLKLKIDLPSAQQHYTPNSRPTYITSQWKNRKKVHGLHATGTR